MLGQVSAYMRHCFVVLQIVALDAFGPSSRLLANLCTEPHPPRRQPSAPSLLHGEGVVFKKGLKQGTVAARRYSTSCLQFSQVAALDALALAPAAVQEAIQKRQEQQSRGEAAWESMMSSGGVGGGGTHLSTEVVCPSCGEKRAQVHTILSGGTYAQVPCGVWRGLEGEGGACTHRVGWRGIME
jgi:hypothetical protein